MTRPEWNRLDWEIVLHDTCFDVARSHGHGEAEAPALATRAVFYSAKNYTGKKTHTQTLASYTLEKFEAWVPTR